MKWIRHLGIAFVLTVTLACLLADFVAPAEAGRRRDAIAAACEKAGREPFAMIHHVHG